jgi:hypothetical protein
MSSVPNLPPLSLLQRPRTQSVHSAGSEIAIKFTCFYCKEASYTKKTIIKKLSETDEEYSQTVQMCSKCALSQLKQSAEQKVPPERRQTN